MSRAYKRSELGSAFQSRSRSPQNAFEAQSLSPTHAEVSTANRAKKQVIGLLKGQIAPGHASENQKFKLLEKRGDAFLNEKRTAVDGKMNKNSRLAPMGEQAAKLL